MSRGIGVLAWAMIVVAYVILYTFLVKRFLI